MLKTNAKKKHLSFHTPGHKVGKWDITELSFSDNLSCPRGVIAEAERDVAQILGAEKSFILTDGSTSGVLSMLKASGIKTLALSKNSHKSVFNGCALLGIKTVFFDSPVLGKIPLQVPRVEMNEKLKQADALFLTSPDYYGNIADLIYARTICDEQKKLLLIDGAHGSHLHFEKALYAGTYADLWVDGVHKSLPALTQGAIVSAKTSELSEKLRRAVDIFRTTSPSYPVMASVEYAVKYPRNAPLETAVLDFVKKYPDFIYFGGDRTKLCAIFGSRAFEIEKYLENRGIYPEFCDGNILMFYLSPATTKRDFNTLKKQLIFLFSRFGTSSSKGSKLSENCCSETLPDHSILQTVSTPLTEHCCSEAFPDSDGEIEWVSFSAASGRICARPCGLFPPCTPLLQTGERITEEKIRLLQNADNVFGLKDGSFLCVFK